MSSINQADRARLAWLALADVARARETITYLGLGVKLGIHHRAVRYVLGPIQDYCLETGIAPLTILVVNGSGRPGTGFIAHDPNDLENGLEEVWSFDWRAIQNPFDFADKGLSYPSLMKTLTHNPDDAGFVYQLVKSRGVQQILFRDAVRKAYAGTCAFSRMQFPDALQACHIIPWAYSTPQQRLDVRNGILLNPLHHCLFDKAYLTISPEYRIIYWDSEGEGRTHNDLERALTIDLHGQLMKVPHFARHRPLPDYIRRHNELINWEAF